MIILVIYISSVIVITLVGYVIGVTVYDIRLIRLEKRYRQHPHANQWRRRPAIAIPGSLPAHTIRKLKKQYRNLEITDTSQVVQSELQLTLPATTTIDRDGVLQSLRYLAAFPTASHVEISPPLTQPSTVRELLFTYRMIVAMTLAKARAGLGVSAVSSPLAVLSKSSVALVNPSKITRLYRIVSCSTALITPCIVGYALYLALIPRQPGMLVLCVGGFCSFVTFAIWSHRSLTVINKVTYTLLIPITLGYFTLLAMCRPLKMLTDVAKAKVPISIGLFARIKYILRIV